MRTSVALSALVLAGLAGLATRAAPAHADEPAAAPAPASAPAAAPTTTATAVVHVPPGHADRGDDLELIAIVDGGWREPELVAHWRPLGDAGSWREAPLARSSAGGWYATVPAGDAGVEYWIGGRTADGAEVAHFASAAAPHAVPVVPHLVDQLADVDRARHGGRADLVALSVEAQDFGNRFDRSTDRRRDQYVRAEATWTHRFFRGLYAASFGFGAIEGHTPDGPDADAMELRHRARYGFGEVRARLHPSVFVDLRGTLGVAHDGFIAGIGGAVTLGRPWATSVSFGGEALQSLGPSGYIRLQWDTAPPLLMGASVIKTDLPGARLDDGVMLRYDVAYPVTPQWTLRGALSAGARDGSAHVGGGLGVAHEF